MGGGCVCRHGLKSQALVFDHSGTVVSTYDSTVLYILRCAPRREQYITMSPGSELFHFNWPSGFLSKTSNNGILSLLCAVTRGPPISKKKEKENEARVSSNQSSEGVHVDTL